MKKIFFTVLSCVLCAEPMSASIPPGYYDAADGKKKEALKNAIHDIIKNADVLSYGAGSEATWDGFYDTDRMADNKVRDRYSYGTFYFTSRGAVPSGMNIEHSFPKSWWGGSKNQAYKDIHHLMPCESKINSSKGNYPMGVVTDVTTNNGCTKVGKGPGAGGKLIQLWEPADEWKGDFARTYFYMATCYQNLSWTSAGTGTLTNGDWPTLQEWAYKLFLQWCKDDPVDDIERERNEAVYKRQGNRNPFIDYPYLAEYIWGDSIAYAFSVSGSSTTPIDPDPIVPDDPKDPTVLIDETFEASQGGNFTVCDVYGGYSTVWEHSSTYKCMVANAFNKGKEADAWLVSSELDLTDYRSAKLTFDHATGFNYNEDADGHFFVKVSTDYEGCPQVAQWTTLQPDFPARPSKNFTQFESAGEVDLSAFAGQKIRVAFQYTATADACYAWEIRNVRVTGEPVPTSIHDNFASPVSDAEGVFTIGGTYVGNRVPESRGIYVVRRNRHAYKVVVP
ncbi:MAG: endonuclease [Clostridium sp.]|nr:endonuclease [Clostridium sp.]